RNGIGVKLGTTYGNEQPGFPDGGTWAFGRAAFNDLLFSDNDTGMYFQSVGSAGFSNIFITRTAGAPPGQSHGGLCIQAGSNIRFSKMNIGGGFSTAGVLGSNTLRGGFFGNTVSNTVSTANSWVWANRGSNLGVLCAANSICTYTNLGAFTSLPI